MPSLILKMLMSVDGFVGDKNGNVEWAFPYFDDEFTAWGVDSIQRAGTHVMGGNTGNALAQYWPAPTEPRDLPFAPAFNAAPKIIFSKTLESVDWNNTRVLHGDIEAEIPRLKAESAGEYILVHGGARLARSLSALGLIDEYHLMVVPVALGAGDAIFPAFNSPLHLELIEARPFQSGCVLQCYRRKESSTKGAPA